MWLKFLFCWSCTVKSDEKNDILTQTHTYSNIEKISFIFKLFGRSVRFAAFNVWPFVRGGALHARENLYQCVCVCKLNIAMVKKEKILWRHLSWKHVRLPLNCQQTFKGWMSCPVTSVVVVVVSVFIITQFGLTMRLKGLQFVCACVWVDTGNVASRFAFFLFEFLLTWASVHDNATSVELFPSYKIHWFQHAYKKQSKQIDRFSLCK